MTDNEKPTLMVIDGHSLAFRAFYALPVDSFMNREGQHTNAIHGFISMMNNLLANEKPTHLAVAFADGSVRFVKTTVNTWTLSGSSSDTSTSSASKSRTALPYSARLRR